MEFPADLITLTEEILNGKHNFQCSVLHSNLIESSPMFSLMFRQCLTLFAAEYSHNTGNINFCYKLNKLLFYFNASQYLEAVARMCSVGTVFYKNFADFTGKQLCRILFFNENAGLVKIYCEFCEVFKGTNSMFWGQLVH